MSGESLFTIHSKQELAKSIADFLPGGDLFVAKGIEDTVLINLLNGLSLEIQRAEQLLSDYTSETDITTTTQLISEWETAVGIPDSCFSNTVSLEERRINVQAKILALGVATEEDFINLAAFLGYAIIIEHPEPVEFYPPYDIPLDLIWGVPQSRFIWYVIGAGVVPNVPPYDIPLSLENGTSVIQCLFDKLKPANTLIIYRNS